MWWKKRVCDTVQKQEDNEESIKIQEFITDSYVQIRAKNQQQSAMIINRGRDQEPNREHTQGVQSLDTRGHQDQICTETITCSYWRQFNFQPEYKVCLSSLIIKCMSSVNILSDYNKLEKSDLSLQTDEDKEFPHFDK